MIAPSTPARAWSRLLAWLIDCVCILGWIVVLTVIGALVRELQDDGGALRWEADPVWVTDPLAAHVVIALLTVVPVTGWLAWRESRGATPGKRLRGLVVMDERGGPPSFWNALIRNTLKVAVLWQAGHLVFGHFVTHPDVTTLPLWVSVTIAAIYPIMGWYVLSLFFGTGRTPYDRASRTRVEMLQRIG